MPPCNPQTVVLITASSAGLGAATARAFASNGARVVVNYCSNKEKAENLVKELSQLSSNTSQPPSSSSASSSSPLTSPITTPQHTALRADIGIRSELICLVEETVTTMGRLDVVVSNHAWTHIRDFYNLDDNIDEEDWDRCYHMNVKSHLFLFHACKRYLDAAPNGGAFITTASLAGVIPSGSSLAYSITKAAQIHLVKALAKISPSISVNSVSPGILLTDWGRQFPEEKLQNAINRSPLKRLALIEDVAAQIVCLANSRSVTGTNSVIDAGWSLN